MAKEAWSMNQIGNWYRFCHESISTFSMNNYIHAISYNSLVRTTNGCKKLFKGYQLITTFNVLSGGYGTIEERGKHILLISSSLHTWLAFRMNYFAQLFRFVRNPSYSHLEDRQFRPTCRMQALNLWITPMTSFCLLSTLLKVLSFLFLFLLFFFQHQTFEWK